jgi:hypothetical protein
VSTLAAAGYSGRVTPQFVSVPDIADRLGVVVTKVHQLLRDRTLIAVRRDGKWVIPAEFVADGEIVRGLSGTITVLADAGFGDDEIVGWLFADEPSGTAMAALRAGQVKAVHRRAQIAGF